MELFFVAAVFLIIIAAASFKYIEHTPQNNRKTSPYRYVRKPYIMTEAETNFFKRLQKIVEGKYLIFPQVHLSSLAKNITPGRYRKAGFQRINRRSVDYVLADIETLQAVYAIELDDRTHDNDKGKAVDALKADILEQVRIPLIRFRSPQTMTDDDIIQSFKSARAEADRVY